jgi:chorismate mutase/prephenate dehydratase
MLKFIKYKNKNVDNLSEDEREKTLDGLRDSIDTLDNILVYVLNLRTKLAIKIAKIKVSMGMPTYVPERERIIMERISKKNKGPLSQESLFRIYERVLDQSRATQRAETKRKDDGTEGKE